MRYCKTCLFPETKPDLYFDSLGICDACTSAKRKHGLENSVNWMERAQNFEKILKDAKKRCAMYDCVVPVSGGKDSIWQVYAMKYIHKTKPLAVTFDQFDQTNTGRNNLETLKSLGVDHIHFTLNPKIIKNLVKKGFKIVGDPYWVNHVGIWTVPMHIANKLNIPLVIFGENPIFEYGGPEFSRDNMVMDKKWRQEFGGMRGFREEDMADEEISIEDLKMLQYPDDLEIKKNNILGLFYGSFFKWEPIKHTKFMKKFGWKSLKKPQKGSWLTTENCDMGFIDIREGIKYLKYGYGRATDQLNVAIRQGVIKRSNALKIVKKIDGKVDEKNIKKFCKYIGVTRNEYHDVLESFVNHDLFVKDNKGKWRLKINRN